MIEFELEGKKYQAERLDAMIQFRVLKRMGSLFPSVVSGLSMKDRDPLMGISYVAAAVSKLSDTDSDYVIQTCLSVCKVQQGQIWASLSSPQGQLMFKETTLQEIMQIVWKVLEDNFRDFIQDLVAKASAAGTPV
jgi:hypothetical protein